MFRTVFFEGFSKVFLGVSMGLFFFSKKLFSGFLRCS